MSNINTIILYEMQPLVNMLDSFKQALNISGINNLQSDPSMLNSMPDGNVQDQQSGIPDPSMINNQLTSQ